MEEFIEIKKVKEEVNLMSPLTWAYVGDAVYELYIEIKRSMQEVKLLPPLTWAYVGDCVYELYIRTKLVNETNLKPHKLHIESIKYVKAGAQAKLLEKIYENLTNEEQEIVRRSRNTQNHHLPKNSNVQEYTKQNNRLKEILKQVD